MILPRINMQSTLPQRYTLDRKSTSSRLGSVIRLVSLFLVPLSLSQMAAGEELFTQKGTDLSFKELLAQKKLNKGAKSTNGVTGSTIRVNRRLVETTPEAKARIAQDINIHTLGNSMIPRNDFEQWSRWYQEDGSTQVFRLFSGEVNVRNERDNAARIEAFSKLQWKRGDWHEWSGTYTLIKPHGAAIFQVKNNENDWAIQLNANDKGDILLNERREKDKVIAKEMIGKSFHVRIRDNGHDYEVFLNGEKVGNGSYARPSGVTTFRWGMYLGGNPVTHDAMIFVSGATIDGKAKK